MRVPAALRIAIPLLALLPISQTVEACIVAYTDSNVNTAQSKIEAWAFVEDYFDESYCYEGAIYQWWYWEHSYDANVYISSPTQNWVYGTDSESNVPYGGGSAYTFVSISYLDDPGDYEVDWWIWLLCTIGGIIIDDYVDGQVNPGTGGGPACSGTPATMANEYLPLPTGVYSGGVSPQLQCSDFRFFPPSLKILPNFTWSEVNGGFTNGNPHTGWGHMNFPALVKLQFTRNSYGNAIVLSSGYRCPHGNASPTVNGDPNSYHMQGRSFDMYNSGGWQQPYWSQAEFDLLKSHAEAQGTIESLPYNYYSDRHYHVTF